VMRNFGYTLIEILVAITIIGILFSVGYANFRSFSQRQVVLNAAKSLQSDLRLAQQMALSGQKPDDKGCKTNPLDGIQFGMTTGAPYLYRLRAVCGSDMNNYPIIKEFDFPSDITPSPVTFAPNPVIFKVLGNGTNIPAGGSVVITLTQTGTNNKAAITITAGGEIK
jgi:prepilin-type N-terminal cleavage/methylation domain-containing protein